MVGIVLSSFCPALLGEEKEKSKTSTKVPALIAQRLNDTRNHLPPDDLYFFFLSPYLFKPVVVRYSVVFCRKYSSLVQLDLPS